MLTPIHIELAVVQARNIVIATYTNDPNDPERGGPLYLAFYTKDDLSSMLHLFYPGDREPHRTRERALEEIGHYGFD